MVNTLARVAWSLASFIAGTIFPGVTGFAAADLLFVVAEFFVDALLTKDFLLIAICVLPRIQFLSVALRTLLKHVACQNCPQKKCRRKLLIL